MEIQTTIPPTYLLNPMLEQPQSHDITFWKRYNSNTCFHKCIESWINDKEVHMVIEKSSGLQYSIMVIMCLCVFVFFPFILDIKFVGRTSRGHTGGRSHRISHPPSFCGACLNFSREKDSAMPFPRR